MDGVCKAAKRILRFSFSSTVEDAVELPVNEDVEVIGVIV